MSAVAFDDAMSSLLTWYSAADDSQRDRGIRWYDAARSECRRIARESGYTYRQVAAVMAITSPDAQLGTNIRWTRNACLNHGETAGKYPTDQRPKVLSALANRRNPGQYATGPKVSAFYSAIVGNDAVLVIDRWASFAAGGPKDRVPGAKDRREIHAAYLAAAAIADVSVRDFQAIVWIACRESTGAIRRGRRVAVRYADIV